MLLMLLAIAKGILVILKLEKLVGLDPMERNKLNSRTRKVLHK